MKEITIRELQDAQMEFLHTRNLNSTIETQSEKLAEEVPEMLEALAVLQSNYTTANERAFAMEMVDVIIVSMGLIGEMGLDAQDLIAGKMAVNADKYDRRLVLQLQRDGLSPMESMKEAKRLWRLANDTQSGL